MYTLKVGRLSPNACQEPEIALGAPVELDHKARSTSLLILKFFETHSHMWFIKRRCNHQSVTCVKTDQGRGFLD